jgi:hypothetical protein
MASKAHAHKGRRNFPEKQRFLDKVINKILVKVLRQRGTKAKGKGAASDRRSEVSL